MKTTILNKSFIYKKLTFIFLLAMLIFYLSRVSGVGETFPFFWIHVKNTSYVLRFEPTFHSYLLKYFQNLKAPTAFVKLAKHNLNLLVSLWVVNIASMRSWTWLKSCWSFVWAKVSTKMKRLSCVLAEVSIGCVPWNGLKMLKSSFWKKPMTFFYQFSTDDTTDEVSKNQSSLGIRLSG